MRIAQCLQGHRFFLSLNETNWSEVSGQLNVLQNQYRNEWKWSGRSNVSFFMITTVFVARRFLCSVSCFSAMWQWYLIATRWRVVMADQTSFNLHIVIFNIIVQSGSFSTNSTYMHTLIWIDAIFEEFAANKCSC